MNIGSQIPSLNPLQLGSLLIAVLVGVNDAGRGDVYLALSSDLMFVVGCCGRNLEAISAIYLAWSRVMV